jgi:hypothetical protein
MTYLKTIYNTGFIFKLTYQCAERTFLDKYLKIYSVKPLTVNRLSFMSSALLIHCSCVEMTDNTDMSILLNSSKHPQAPHWHNPANIWPTARKSIPSPQFVTTHSNPKAFAKSLVVSVLPVPAGPD